jgi:hypothetical protein
VVEVPDRQEQLRHAAESIGSVVERTFADVEVVRDALLACHRDARARGERLSGHDLERIAESVVPILSDPDAVPVGLGVIVAPDVLADEPLYLAWWQGISGGADRLDFDLNAASLGFYDYLRAEWFERPRRSGKRHIVGPYVDVHGTDRYLLTVTEPVAVDGEFIGVAGADVAVGHFEELVLGELADAAVDVVVVNEERRVVVSSSGRWLVGSLLARTPSGATVLDLADLPWRVAVCARADESG